MADDMKLIAKMNGEESEPDNKTNMNDMELDEDDCQEVYDEDDINLASEEFKSINHQLDELNSALDALEEKNDSIQSKLKELLESNREARQQFQASQKTERQEDTSKSS